MQKINLSNALRLQKRAAQQIGVFLGRVQTYNSIEVGNETREYDVQESYDNWLKSKEILIEFKTRIEAATLPIRAKILQLAELKSNIVDLRRISTKHGKTRPQWDGDTDHEFDAVLGQKLLDSKSLEFQKQIDQLQSEVDEFNATTFIEVPDIIE